MSSAVYRSSPPLSVPPTQNTALVLEFNCLYTHDIRRKQKRWQDGFLRFHTFNKRVMVYDVPRNFIGDTHWREDTVLQDGDEVMLESEGVAVQVGEEIGKTETDLTELRRSSKKAPNEGTSSSPVRGAQVPPLQLLSRSGPMNAPQSKHRSLHSLLSTPQRLIGKAILPTESPFDKRHSNSENHEWESGQPPKKRRITDPPSSNGWKSATNKPFVSASAMNPPTRDTSTPMHARKKQLASTEPFHISMDPKEQPHHPSTSHSALPIPSSSPASQRQKTPDPPHKQQHTTTQHDTPAPHKPHANPSTNQNERHSIPPKAKPTTQPTPPNNSRAATATAAATTTAATAASSPEGTTLRMIASAPKRKTLVFQQQQQHTGKRKAPSPAARNSLG
ncbi:hypothetical protein BDY17DRAFT_299356 [Neohortaea acidophila]|uniref:5'-3' DNA helicase ZGRF1-like N-terminal domain-containing protein n=1 Tax=Neohortaea acidophila TaxID=245834 RepID=A0A6A6PPS2_9PEZI|nr:uncharacterized protein BDY17DRAFT_299356 [Neohortaea acidophila]KAF2481624.1 hypothetical protein BDY17DRAFT_299356 [Neohortaea acidophila]